MPALIWAFSVDVGLGGEYTEGRNVEAAMEGEWASSKRAAVAPRLSRAAGLDGAEKYTQ